MGVMVKLRFTQLDTYTDGLCTTRWSGTVCLLTILPEASKSIAFIKRQHNEWCWNDQLMLWIIYQTFQIRSLNFKQIASDIHSESRFPLFVRASLYSHVVYICSKGYDLSKTGTLRLEHSRILFVFGLRLCRKFEDLASGSSFCEWRDRETKTPKLFSFCPEDWRRRI